MLIFDLKGHKTTVKTELVAGFTTFLTMIYILPVNSHILSGANMPVEALVCATALITAFSCILCGLFANTPIAISVAMGMNVYFAYTVCIAYDIAWQVALGAVFLSSLLFLLLSFTKFRMWIINGIPKDLRLALCAGIGLFISFIGLSQMGVIVKNEATIVGIGNFSDVNVLFSLFSLGLILLFYCLNIKAAFILGVLLSACIAWIFNIGGAALPQSIVSLPNFSQDNGLGAIFMQLDIKSALELSILPIILTFFAIQLFDSVGTVTGLAQRSKIFEDKKISEKKLGRTLIADAAASTCAGVVGTSPVVTYIESASGIESGGKTGLCAVVVGLCFLLSLFFLPLFKAIPSACIYPVLVMVGILMFSEVRHINFNDKAVCIASFFMIFMMPLSYSITTGFAFGFLAYVLACVFTRQKISLFVFSLSLISLAIFILENVRF